MMDERDYINVAEIINTMHDIILEITIFLGLDLTDKIFIYGFLA